MSPILVCWPWKVYHSSMLVVAVAVLFYLGGYSPSTMASGVARAYYGGLGALPQWGPGAKPPCSWWDFSKRTTPFTLKLWSNLVKSNSRLSKIDDMDMHSSSNTAVWHEVIPPRVFLHLHSWMLFIIKSVNSCEGFGIRKLSRWNFVCLITKLNWHYIF